MTADAPVALLWFAAVSHPDSNVRTQVRSLLLSGSDTDDMESIRADVEARLRSERGTIIEPFELSEGDVALACDLAMFALPKSGGALQVVSRDKVAPEGGLLLVRSPNQDGVASGYLECLAGREATATLGVDQWRFSPGHIPDTTRDSIVSEGITGVARVDDDGLEVRIGPFPFSWGVQGDESTATRPNADEPETPGHLGLVIRSDIHGGGTWLVLQPVTPEAMIRMTAAMAGEAWLRVDLLGNRPPFAAVALRLELPEGDRTARLTVVRVLGDPLLAQLSAWLATGGRAVETPESIRQTVGRWLGIPPTWATTEFLEGCV